jgi:hypothetical protein
MISYADTADGMIDLWDCERDNTEYNSNIINVSSFKGLYKEIIGRYDYIFVDTCRNGQMDCPCYAGDYVGMYPTYVIVESGVLSKFNMINSTYSVLATGAYHYCGHNQFRLVNPKRIGLCYDEDQWDVNGTSVRGDVYLYQLEHGAVCVFDSSVWGGVEKVNSIIRNLKGRACLLTNANIPMYYIHFNGDVYHRDTSSDVIEFKGSGNSRTTEGTPAEQDLGKIIFDIDVFKIEKVYDRWELHWREVDTPEKMNFSKVYGLTTIRHMFCKGHGSFPKNFKWSLPSSVVDTREAFYDAYIHDYTDAIVIDCGSYRMIKQHHFDLEELFKIAGQRLPEYTTEDGTLYKSWQKCYGRFTEGGDVIEIDVLKLLDKYNLTEENVTNLLPALVEQCINGYFSPSCGFREHPKRIYLSSTKAIVITHYSDTGD